MKTNHQCQSALAKAEIVLRERWIAALLLLFLLTSSFSAQIAQAQSVTPGEEFGPSLTPNSQLPGWIIDEIMTDNPSLAGVTAADVRTQSPKPSLIIDSDFGVDDTVAVAALLSLEQGIAMTPIPVEIQALVTVAGATTVENATYNAQLLLAQYGLTDDDIPVIMGAKKPQKQKLSSTGKLIHGPDGLWWLAQITQEQASDQLAHRAKGKSPKAKDFYCKEAELSGATLLTLGPLTNVADAIKSCKKTFEKAEGLQLIVLGGVDMTGTESPPMGNERPIVGNTTPVTEYNFWQDPEAAEYVFDFAKPKNPGEMPVLKITVIPQNTFTQYVITDEIQALATSPNAIGQWLTFPTYPPPYVGFPGPLPLYANVQSENGFAPGIPDLVAAAYAVDPSVRTSPPATPSVVSIFGDSKASGFVGGESLMAQSLPVPAIGPDGTPLGFDVYLGTTEQISQVYDDKTLSNLADAVFASDIPFDANYGLLEDFLLGAIVAPPNNAQVVGEIEPASVRAFLLNTLTAPFTSPMSSSADATRDKLSDDTGLDEPIFLPFVTSE